MGKIGFVLAGLTTLTTPLLAQASVQDKADLVIAKQLAAPSRKGWTSVIVKTEGSLTASQKAAIQALGGDIYRHLPIINSLAVRVPKKSLGKLAALPFVSRLSSDMEVKKTDEFTVGHSGADVAWGYGLTGKGIGVAILDSGVSPWHRDLSEGFVSRVTRGVDLVQDGSMSSDPCGHGTHVAGILAGNGLGSTGTYAYRTFKGVAPTVKVVSVRVLNAEGQGTVSNTVAGIQWVMDNRVAQGIRVLNLSLGHEVGESYKDDPLCRAVEKAWKSGLVVVCAAGNGGRRYSQPAQGRDNEGYGTNYGSIQSPANSPYVITVGAVKNTSTNLRLADPIATYSSRGPSRLDLVLKPDIVAPGNRVISLNADIGNNLLSRNFSATNALPWSAYLQGNTSDSASWTYFYLSGTSMAAPVVSGAAALLLHQDPTLTPDAIKARLMLSADKLGNDPTAYGAGLLNIPAALSNRAQPTVHALSPVLSLQKKKGRVLVDSSKAIWGISVNGTQAIWGEQAIWGTQAIWGEQAIWGSSSPYLAIGSFMIDDPVWIDKAIWGTTTSRVDLTSTAIQGEN